MKTILVPVDFSPAMEGVIARAQEMARAFAAQLHLVHVHEIAALPAYPAATIGYPGIGIPEMGMTTAVPTSAGLSAEEMPNEKRTTRLETLQEELTRDGLSVTTHQP